MPLSWKRKPKFKQVHKERRQERINRVAWNLYENRFSHKKQIDKDNIWTTAEKIAKSPLRAALFTCNRPFIKLEKLIWEPILTWANNQALLSLLGVVGNVGLIIAVGMYIGSEKQRRDTEVLTAWQTLTNAHGQPGNGGRIKALEFLNASPRNAEYDYLGFLNDTLRNENYDKYPGANWRRRASCLWICTWKPESLAGIDLSAGDDVYSSAYLSKIQLPRADLESANLKGANLRDVNLEAANLESANLEEAVLWHANLKDAILKFSNLKGTELSNVNLEGADLLQANLENAVLWEANLKGAVLSNANLAGANLTGSDLERAILTEAKLTAADLKSATLTSTYLQAANLESTKSLTQAQLSTAKLCRTKLPPNISLDPNRDCEEVGINPEIGELEEQF